jgi:hypothetical protein
MPHPAAPGAAQGQRLAPIAGKKKWAGLSDDPLSLCRKGSDYPGN